MTVNDFFPVSSSILDEDKLLNEVQKKYSINKIMECKYIAVSLNNTYKITTSDKIYYLRVVKHNWKNSGELKAEIEIINHLLKENIPVAAPVRMKDGEFIDEVQTYEGVRYLVLFEEAKGLEVDSLNEIQIGLLGEIFAKLHNSLDKIDHSLDRPNWNLDKLLDEALISIKPLLAHRMDDYNELQELSSQLKDKIKLLLPESSPEYGLCHFDLHQRNFRIDDNNNFTLFDFDCCGYSYRAYDLARYYDYIFHGSENEKELEYKWSLFVKGYRSVKVLSEKELQAVRYFYPVSYIWCMGLQCEGSSDWGRDWLNDDHFTGEIEFIKNRISKLLE